MDYPFLYKFNYTLVVARLEEKDYLLDATDPCLPFGMIPPVCLNGYGLIVDNNESLWVKLESRGRYVQSTQAVMKLDSTQQNFNTEIIQKLDGFAGLEYRKLLYDVDDPESKMKHYEGNQITDVSIENLEDVGSPLVITYQSTSENTPADILYVDLVVADAIQENPFKAPVRNFPVDYNYPSLLQYRLTFEIPDGYVVDELPESVQHELDDKSVQFAFIADVKGDKYLQVYSKIAINQAEVGAANYAALKKLYDAIVDKHAAVAVLKKIK